MPGSPSKASSRAFPSLLLGTLAVLAPAPPAPAAVQEDPWKEVLEEASTHLLRGRLDLARFTFQEVLEAREEPVAAHRPPAAAVARALAGVAEVLSRTGQYREASEKVRRALELADPWPEALVLAGRLAEAVGALEEAEGFYRRAAEGFEDAMEARYRMGLLLSATGRRDEARETFRSLVQAVSARGLSDWSALCHAGLAQVELGRYQEASALLVRARRLAPERPEPSLGLGHLYFHVYGEAEGHPSGEQEFQRVLRENGDVEEALLGLYRLRRANFMLQDQERTEGYLRTALLLNPRSAEALTEQAASLIGDRRFEEARGVLDRALEVNPRNRRTLAHRAALAFLTGDEEGHGRFRERALEVDPLFAEVDSILGDHLVALYRFQDAIPLFQRALQADPELVPALDGMGRAGIYAGRPDARMWLEKAMEQERGFAAPWRRNAITVSRRIEEGYVEVPAGDLLLVLHPEEAEVLGHYLAPFYGEAWDVLSRKYGHVPEPPVRVETFHRFSDFSVRTVGFTGFGALGACFGRLITAVSPAAPQIRGRFNWAATAWHEFSHVIHLGLSRHRVPRWLTEGLAVYEERMRDPAWDRGMERDLLDAFHNQEIFPVRLLNSAFRGPRILFGYYQGGLLVEMLARDHGFPSVVEMLRAYGRDLPAERIFKESFGLGMEEVDRRFHRFVEEKLAPLRLRPRYSQGAMERLRGRLQRESDDLDARLSLAWGFLQRDNTVDAGLALGEVLRRDPSHAGAKLLEGEMARRRGQEGRALALLEEGLSGGAEDFFARLAAAELRLARDDTEAAVAHLEAAREAWPRCQDPALSPHVRLAHIHGEAGDKERQMRELAAYCAFAGNAHGPRLALAAFFRERGMREEEVRYLREAALIDPFDRGLHRNLGEALLERGKPAEAAAEFRVALAVPPLLDRAHQEVPPSQRPGRADPEEVEERAGLRLLLARALREAGQEGEAARELRRILDEAPGSRPAAEAERRLQELR